MRNTFSRKSRLHGHLSPGTISLMNMYLYIKLPHTKSVSSLCEKTFWYKTKTSSLNQQIDLLSFKNATASLFLLLLFTKCSLLIFVFLLLPFYHRYSDQCGCSISISIYLSLYDDDLIMVSLACLHAPLTGLRAPKKEKVSLPLDI